MASLSMRRIMSRITLILVVTLLGVQASAASSVLNYEHRVVRAAEQIERVKVDKEYHEEGISHIKGLLPRSEKVEYEGTETTVDNTWLYVLLDSYAAEKDPLLRIARLTEAHERLRALDAHLRGAEAAGSDQSGDPRDKIREILSRPAYPTEHETAVGALIKKVLRKIRGFQLGRAHV